MRRKFVILLLPALLLSGCVDNNTQNVSSGEIVSTTETVGLINYEYEDLGEKLIYWDDIPNMELPHYYVYFFSRTCNHCQHIKNLVIPILLRKRIFFACESSKEHRVCSNQFYGDIKTIDYCILGYPTIIEIKNGSIVRYANGENEVLSLLNTK